VITGWSRAPLNVCSLVDQISDAYGSVVI